MLRNMVTTDAYTTVVSEMKAFCFESNPCLKMNIIAHNISNIEM